MSREALDAFAAAHPFAVAFDEEGAEASPPLLRVYGGPLAVRTGVPRVVANFVTTADGVTSFGAGSGEGAAAVSLHSAADRFVMALLRCAADCVLIGASTLREDPHHQWVPSTLLRDLAGELAEHRRLLTGSGEPPPLAVVSGSGALPGDHPALCRPATDVLIVTTEEGTARLPDLPPRVRVAVEGRRGKIAAGAVVEAVRRHLDATTVLCEGGPQLFGELLRGGRIDELFLTIAPQIAGRSDTSPRPGLAAAHAFGPANAPRLRLRSLRRSADHLFLRYVVEKPGGETPPPTTSPRKATM
jgi:riboflavin biosynthesis pyrimidine reductase